MEMEMGTVVMVDCRVDSIRTRSYLVDEILLRISVIRIISNKLNRGDISLRIIITFSLEEVKEMEEEVQVVMGIGDEMTRELSVICVRILMCLLILRFAVIEYLNLSLFIEGLLHCFAPVAHLLVEKSNN
jgi:hypothetical protein